MASSMRLPLTARVRSCWGGMGLYSYNLNTQQSGHQKRVERRARHVSTNGDQGYNITLQVGSPIHDVHRAPGCGTGRSMSRTAEGMGSNPGRVDIYLLSATPAAESAKI